jgi:hypothetical protein
MGRWYLPLARNLRAFRLAFAVPKCLPIRFGDFGLALAVLAGSSSVMIPAWIRAITASVMRCQFRAFIAAIRHSKHIPSRNCGFRWPHPPQRGCQKQSRSKSNCMSAILQVGTLQRNGPLVLAPHGTQRSGTPRPCKQFNPVAASNPAAAFHGRSWGAGFPTMTKSR